MFLTLTAGGLAEGFMAMNLVPREAILRTMQPFWLVRTITGSAIIVGVSCLLANMVMTAFAARREHVDVEYSPYEETQGEVSVGTV